MYFTSIVNASLLFLMIFSGIWLLNTDKRRNSIAAFILLLVFTILDFIILDAYIIVIPLVFILVLYVIFIFGIKKYHREGKKNE